MYEVFATVISGVLIFVLSQLILKIFIDPIQELRLTIGKISEALIYHADVYCNPKRYNGDVEAKTKKYLRNLSSLLVSKAHNVPVYEVFSLIGLIPSIKKIEIASSNLIGISNFNTGTSRQNHEKREKIGKALSIIFYRKKSGKSRD